MVNVSTILPIDLNSDISGRIALEKLPYNVKELRFKTYFHSAFLNALEGLRDTFAMSGFEATGCTLFGEPGVGKSRLIRYFVTEVYAKPEYQLTNNLTPIPIISIRVPGKPTINSICEQILKCTQKHYTPPSRTGDSIRLRVTRVLQYLNVEMIIFDEFQHLLRKHATIRTADVVAFIKVLMDEHGLSVVFAGLPEAQSLLEEHPELSQRMSFAKVDLYPFSLEEDGPCNLRDFVAYIKSIEGNFNDLGVKIFPLASIDMITRLYLATLGNPRRIGQLFNRVMLKYHDKYAINTQEFQQVFSQMPFNKTNGYKLFTEPPTLVKTSFDRLLKMQREIPLYECSKHKAGSRLGL
ncbi:TniB family NTP-binding protein [Pseudomonadota bacterium]